jgi:hypothetical protein
MGTRRADMGCRESASATLPNFVPPPNPTKCDGVLGNPRKALLDKAPCKSLILRAANLRDQGVGGSNPLAPTNSFWVLPGHMVYTMYRLHR